MLFFLLIVTGCSSTFKAINIDDAPELVDTIDLENVGPSKDTPHNLEIRFDQVTTYRATGDFTGADELQFIMVLIREEGDSLKDTRPGQGVYTADGYVQFDLSGFSEQVNNVLPEERVLLTFIAADQDSPDFWQQFSFWL